MSTFRQLMMRQKQTSDDYLAFTAEEAGSTISLSVTGSPTYNLKYSLDNITWQTFADSSTFTLNTITLNNVDDKCYIKGSYTNQNYNAYITFTLSKHTSVSGNAYSILNENNFESITDLSSYGNYCFYHLFDGCETLTGVQDLELPATTLANDCYSFMFNNCKLITATPELPAITLYNFCYCGMFNGCTSLVNAPELPANTLASNCYYRMFYSCTSLVNVPELPATTLATGCYESMFYNCHSLIQAPELPATTLAINCYNSMFYGCSSLNYIKLLYTGTFNTNFVDWVNGVSATGNFYYNGTDTSNFDDSAIPIGWTIQTFS